ncbi:MAG: hypothetical protein ACR2O7_17225 [Parasphingorhabdus sp.]
MAKLISAEGLTEAWLAAAEYLFMQPKQECVSLFLSIEKPTAVSKVDKAAMEIVEGFQLAHGRQPLDTVADTIFPKSHYKSAGLKGVMDDYPNAMEELLSAGRDDLRGSWGTYALRMLRQKMADGTYVNQLERTLHKLAIDNKKACFELSAGPIFVDASSPENVAEMTTYDIQSDKSKQMGMACLSHLSFTRENPGGKLHLNGTYRSHYYIERALGNLIGLAGLLAFVAEESGHEIGTLAINSTFAKLEIGEFGGKAVVAGLLKEVRNLY